MRQLGRRLANDRTHPLASAAARTGRRGDTAWSKCPSSGQCPSSVPPQDVPGGSGSLDTPWQGVAGPLAAQPGTFNVTDCTAVDPYQVTGCMYGLSFGIMDVEDAAKGAELRIALQRETRVCYPIGAVAGAFAAVAARAAAGPKRPLGSARGRLPRLLRTRLVALGGSRHPGRETRPLCAELLPEVLEPAASKAADATAFDPSGDGVDMYVGRLRFAGPDAFSICWQVTGPRKEGAISNEYTRQLPPLASDDKTVAAPLP